jgi:hypothetical protein
MKSAVVVATLLAAVPARADRSTVLSFAATLDDRATARTFDEAGKKEGRMLGGGRLTLAFENTPIAFPTDRVVAADLRLVPELLAGFTADDRRAEGMIGAGLRGEVQLANSRRHMRTGIYAAGRGIVIGKDHDSAVEMVIGEYLLLHGATRFGWEGGAMMRPRPNAPARASKELDAVMQVYVGWAL